MLTDNKKQSRADTIKVPCLFIKENTSWNKVIPFIRCDDEEEVFMEYRMELTWWKYDPKFKRNCVSVMIYLLRRGYQLHWFLSKACNQKRRNTYLNVGAQSVVLNVFFVVI